MECRVENGVLTGAGELVNEDFNTGDPTGLWSGARKAIFPRSLITVSSIRVVAL